MTVEQLEGDPHALLADLRSREPVSWLPALDGWLVTSRDLAIEVMRDATTFTVDDPRFSTAQVIGPSMLSTDGAEHARHRLPFVDPFLSIEVKRRFSRWAAVRANELVAGIEPAGKGDLRAGLAAPLAVDVVIEALGLVDVEPAEARRWYDDIVDAVDEATRGRPITEAGRAAYRDLEAVVHATIESGGDSFLSSVHAGGSQSTTEISSNAAVVLFGGIVTSDGATSHLLFQLLSHPDQFEEVRADRSLLTNAFEEALRLEPAAGAVDRYATREAPLGDATIGKSDLVRVSLTGANRDPAVFSDPDRFDVRRPNAGQHLAFARGPHACVGIHLARLEARMAVEAVFDGLPGIRLDSELSKAPSGLIFRAPGAVAASWDPGDR